MPSMRFNHMELSFPRGTLTKEFREDVDAFYCDVLGWDALDTEVVGQSCHLLRPDDGQFILLAESGKPMSSPGYDHLGLLMQTRDEVDSVLAECRRFQDKDDRLLIKEYEDLTGPTITCLLYTSTGRGTTMCRGAPAGASMSRRSPCQVNSSPSQIWPMICNASRTSATVRSGSTLQSDISCACLLYTSRCV